ncbi:hypothetical protein [Paraburkholderia sp. RL17-381-BIF-C]|uniref:hypothetical protein n=1 Tax=Paraburkholderia sp. RL17-381-BIF-C TaxID=3031635 RepID=UPI0038B987FD
MSTDIVHLTALAKSPCLRASNSESNPFAPPIKIDLRQTETDFARTIFCNCLHFPSANYK